MKFNLKITKFIPIICLLFSTLSCRKQNQNPVPFVLTDISININLPSYNGLLSVGGFAYVNGGNKGILVYRKSLNEFVAYDRMSPEENGADCPPLVFDENSALKIIGDCGGSEFSILDGSVISGHSLYPLRGYLTSFNGASALRIYN